MTPRLQAALTVAIHELKRRPYSTIRNDTVSELEAALAAEAQNVDAAPMSQPNRFIAYSAAAKLREIGYEWTGDKWAVSQPKTPADQRCTYKCEAWPECACGPA